MNSPVKEILIHVPVIVAAGQIEPEFLGKPIRITLERQDGEKKEIVLMNTTEGFIEDALLERKVVSQSPGIPPVIEVTELGYFFEGRKVRQDVNACVDPVALGAAVGKVG